MIFTLSLIVVFYFTLPLTIPQVFADLPSVYLLNPVLVDKGEYVNHGSFGDIYHGAVYPSISATVTTSMCLVGGA